MKTSSRKLQHTLSALTWCMQSLKNTHLQNRKRRPVWGEKVALEPLCCFHQHPGRDLKWFWFLKSHDGKMGHKWSEKPPWMAENRWVSLKLFHLQIGVITNPTYNWVFGAHILCELAFCLPRIKKRPQLIEILGVKNLHQIQFMTFRSLSWTFKGSRFHHPKVFWHWGKDFSSWMFG